MRRLKKKTHAFVALLSLLLLALPVLVFAQNGDDYLELNFSDTNTIEIVSDDPDMPYVFVLDEYDQTMFLRGEDDYVHIVLRAVEGQDQDDHDRIYVAVFEIIENGEEAGDEANIIEIATMWIGFEYFLMPSDTYDSDEEDEEPIILDVTAPDPDPEVEAEEISQWEQDVKEALFSVIQRELWGQGLVVTEHDVNLSIELRRMPNGDWFIMQAEVTEASTATTIFTWILVVAVFIAFALNIVLLLVRLRD
ncbi:MAG: hypothetical protein FWE34_04650 [Defluviitaleaceae bacterium]|nr:hypothetical protein [Defluviitaleaceae bacterium]